MRSKIIKSITLFMCLILITCDQSTDPDPGLFEKDMLSGYVQKGPYVCGSVTLLELNDDYQQTGRIFETPVRDNLGYFEFSDLDLQSKYALLKAEGMYFNEVFNTLTNSPLTLFALMDLAENDTICINVLTHLQKSRMEYFLEEGFDYNVADEMSGREILDVFGYDQIPNFEFEKANILEDGEESAVLLASSAIIQGFRSPVQISELLNNLCDDIRKDGKLDAQHNGSALINDSRLLDCDNIRDNLDNYNGIWGSGSAIADFAPYLNSFVENSDFEVTKLIEYPESDEFGVNILDTTKSSFKFNSYYTLAAILPIGTSLVVQMQYIAGPHFYPGSDGREQPHWFFVLNSDQGWSRSGYSLNSHSQSFSAVAVNFETICKTKIQFSNTHGENIFRIKYFENGATEPVLIKDITVR